MPTRIIREGILTSERVNKLSPAAELFYRRLMSVADDYGRYYAHPSLLRAALYPLQLDRVSEADVKQMLSECTAAAPQPLIITYQAGKYLQIDNFRQQTRAKSKFPEPSQNELLIKCEANDKQMRSESESESKAKSITAPLHEALLEHIPAGVRKPSFDEVMVWVRAYGFTSLQHNVNGSTLLDHLITDAKATPQAKWHQHGPKVIKFAIEDARNINERSVAPAGGRRTPDWKKLEILEKQLGEETRSTNHPTDEQMTKWRDMRKQIKELRDAVAKG